LLSSPSSRGSPIEEHDPGAGPCSFFGDLPEGKKGYDRLATVVRRKTRLGKCSSSTGRANSSAEPASGIRTRRREIGRAAHESLRPDDPGDDSAAGWDQNRRRRNSIPTLIIGVTPTGRGFVVTRRPPGSPVPAQLRQGCRQSMGLKNRDVIVHMHGLDRDLRRL
jgi:hypothetical protein